MAVQYFSSFTIGWPVTFYIHGIIGLAWVASWWFNGADSPADHRRILKQEREFIENSIDFERDERAIVSRVYGFEMDNIILLFAGTT